MEPEVTKSPLILGLSLTESALSQAYSQRESNSEWAGLSLRVYLEGKGCDGFFYGVTFDKATDQDHHFIQPAIGGAGRLDLVVDPDSLEFVDGSTIDWVDDERGRGFLVENPMHRAFRGKFFKRAAWQDKLKKKVSDRQTDA